MNSYILSPFYYKYCHYYKYWLKKFQNVSIICTVHSQFPALGLQLRFFFRREVNLAWIQHLVFKWTFNFKASQTVEGGGLMVSVLAAAVPLGLDPAVWSGDPAGHFTTALGWNEYLTRFFDPSLEEQQEPEICKILGQATEPSLKEVKEASSKRFAVCASPLPAHARHTCTESSRV